MLTSRSINTLLYIEEMMYKWIQLYILYNTLIINVLNFKLSSCSCLHLLYSICLSFFLFIWLQGLDPEKMLAIQNMACKSTIKKETILRLPSCHASMLAFCDWFTLTCFIKNLPTPLFTAPFQQTKSTFTTTFESRCLLSRSRPFSASQHLLIWSLRAKTTNSSSKIINEHAEI